MTDIKLQEYRSLAAVTMDLLLLPNGFLDEREVLATAVRVALGTDRLADDEVLPDPDSVDRRGWWADLDADIWDGWRIGTKNWLLSRTKIMDAVSREGSTLERARRYTLDALQPLVERKIASQIQVSVYRRELERIDVYAQIFRGPELEIDLRYQMLWDEIIEPLPAPTVDTGRRVPRRNLALKTYAPIVSGLPHPTLPTRVDLALTTTVPNMVRSGTGQVSAQAKFSLSSSAQIVAGRTILKSPSRVDRVLTTTVPVLGLKGFRYPTPANLELTTVAPKIRLSVRPAAAQLVLSTVAPIGVQILSDEVSAQQLVDEVGGATIIHPLGQ